MYEDEENYSDETTVQKLEFTQLKDKPSDVLIEEVLKNTLLDESTYESLKKIRNIVIEQKASFNPSSNPALLYSNFAESGYLEGQLRLLETILTKAKIHTN